MLARSPTYCVPIHNDDIIVEGSIGVLRSVEVEEITEVVIHVESCSKHYIEMIDSSMRRWTIGQR